MSLRRTYSYDGFASGTCCASRTINRTVSMGSSPISSVDQCMEHNKRVRMEQSYDLFADNQNHEGEPGCFHAIQPRPETSRTVVSPQPFFLSPRPHVLSSSCLWNASAVCISVWFSPENFSYDISILTFLSIF